MERYHVHSPARIMSVYGLSAFEFQHAPDSLPDKICLTEQSVQKQRPTSFSDSSRNDSPYDPTDTPNILSGFDMSTGLYVSESSISEIAKHSDGGFQATMPVNIFTDDDGLEGQLHTLSLETLRSHGLLRPMSTKASSAALPLGNDFFHIAEAMDHEGSYRASSPEQTNTSSQSRELQDHGHFWTSNALPAREKNTVQKASLTGHPDTGATTPQSQEILIGLAVSPPCYQLHEHTSLDLPSLQDKITATQLEVAVIRDALQHRETILDKIQRQTQENHRILSTLLWKYQDSERQ